MNQHRRHVDELGGDVHIKFAYALDISEVLRRDSGNGNVIDVDVLFADQVEQQVERTFIDFAKRDGKREIAGIVFVAFGRDGITLRDRGIILPCG